MSAHLGVPVCSTLWALNQAQFSYSKHQKAESTFLQAKLGRVFFNSASICCVSSGSSHPSLGLSFLIWKKRRHLHLEGIMKNGLGNLQTVKHHPMAGVVICSSENQLLHNLGPSGTPKSKLLSLMRNKWKFHRTVLQKDKAISVPNQWQALTGRTPPLSLW